MRKEHGGSFTVNGWFALALITAAAAAAVSSYWLGTHRTFEINCPELTAPYPLHRTGFFDKPATQTRKKPADDSYTFHTFPEGRGVCTGFDTICWIRI
jgi:hypothetical protein